MGSAHKEFLSHPLIREDFVVRRAYQENIFINCLNKNSLVVIPTGLGKTIIALMLAVHRLTEKQSSKIIFLAPTKPLVNQHYQSFLEITNLEPNALKSITGTIPPDERNQLWEDLKIAFMTPQVLQNDIISNQYTLENVSLMIFDECHRAVGDYAYCYLAKKYVESSQYPQILGLTASPGSTNEKIKEIKDNLFIEQIEIRTEKDPDVKPYIHNVDQEWIKIDLPEEFSEVINIFNEKLKETYKYLKNLELLDSYDVNKVTRKDLLRLNKTINQKISNPRTDEEKFALFRAKKAQANAIRLSHMTELIETQGINALNEYIEKNQRKIKKNQANKSLKELFKNSEIIKGIKLVKQLQSEGLIHPKIKKLRELLNQQLSENPDSRILVFCHFRDSVNNIVSIFEQDEIVRVHKFVGQAKRGLDKGLTQKEQIEILEGFRAGDYNTLIGTSVAEEGLDIAECDLVIFYDVVPSAVRAIQRRGRTGRNKEGKVYILMAKGTRDEGYFWAEKAKENNMRRNLNKMKKDIAEFESNDQKSILSFVKGDNTQKNNIEKIKEAENYDIVCDTRETASPVIRKLSLMGVNLDLKQLKVADYLISDTTGIERKSAQDFNDSIKDGRLFNELIDLKKNFKNPIFILEGNPFLNTSINENALYGAIASIILNLEITLYRTSGVDETATFLYHLAKKAQDQSKGSIKIRYEKAPIDLSYLLEYFIAGIPGINTLRAKSLLKRMKTIQKIFNADIGDLMKAENIGKKIAQEIYKLGRFEYKDEEEKEI